MPVISRRRAPSFLFPFSFAVPRHAFVSFLFYAIVLLALSTHTTCQTITFKPTTFPITPEIAPTPSSLTLVESGNGVPKPTTISPSRHPPLRDIQVPFNSSQITYTPFACNYTTGDVDPDGCEYAWKISNSTREVSISVDSTSGESAELRPREFIIPQMFFQFRASKFTLTTLPTSNATVRLTISSANATFDAFSTTLNTSSNANASNAPPRLLTIVDIPFEDVSILSLSVFPGQNEFEDGGKKYVFGVQSLVVGVPLDAPIASVFPSSSSSSSSTSASLSTSTSTTPPSTSTSSSSSSSDSPPSSSSSSSSNKKRISQALGLTLGLALGLTTVSVLGFWCYRRRRRRRRQGNSDVVSRTSGGPSLTPSPRIRTRLGLEPYGELEKRPDLKDTGRREVGGGGVAEAGAYNGAAARRERDDRISSPSPAFDARSTWYATPRMSSYVGVDRKREDVVDHSSRPAAAPSRGLRWVWGRRRRRGDSTSNSPSSIPVPVPVSPSPSPYSIPLNSPSLVPPRSPVTPTVPSRAFSFLPPSLSRRAPQASPRASPPAPPPPIAPPPTPMPPTPILATAAAALIGKPIVPRKGLEAKDPVQSFSLSSSPSPSTPPPPPSATTPIPTPTSPPIFTTNTNTQRTRPYYPETSHFIYPRPTSTSNNRQSSASVPVTVPRPDSQPPVGPLPPPPQSLTPLSRSRMSDSIRFSQPLLRGGLWVGGGPSEREGSEGGSSPRYGSTPSPSPSPGPSPGYASVGHGTSGRRSVVGVLDVTMGYVNVGVDEEERESDAGGRRSRGWGWGKPKEQDSDRMEGWFEDRDGRTRRRGAASVGVGVMTMLDHVKKRLGGVGTGVFGHRER